MWHSCRSCGNELRRHRQTHVQVGDEGRCVDVDLAVLLPELATLGCLPHRACQDVDGVGRCLLVFPGASTAERFLANVVERVSTSPTLDDLTRFAFARSIAGDEDGWATEADFRVVGKEPDVSVEFLIAVSFPRSDLVPLHKSFDLLIPRTLHSEDEERVRADLQTREQQTLLAEALKGDIVSFDRLVALDQAGSIVQEALDDALNPGTARMSDELRALLYGLPDVPLLALVAGTHAARLAVAHGVHVDGLEAPEWP